MAKHPRTKQTYEFIASDEGDLNVGIYGFSETIKITIASDQKDDPLISELEIEHELLTLLQEKMPSMLIRTKTDVDAEDQTEREYYEQTQEEMDKR